MVRQITAEISVHNDSFLDAVGYQSIMLNQRTSTMNDREYWGDFMSDKFWKVSQY